MDIRAWPSWLKLLVWGGSIFGILGVMQVGIWLLGIQTNVLENGTPLLVVAILTLMALMSIDRRPLADYGLFVGPTWKSLWLWGIGCGVLSYTLYLAVAIGLGVFDLSFSKVSPSRLGQAVLSGLTALPLAATQQFVFSGYLLSILRDRCNRLVAVGISAALFAVLNRLEDLPSLLQPQTQLLVISLFFTACVLGVLRLLTGSILVPAGLLTGWIFVRRFAHKLSLLQPDVGSPWMDWIAPASDPRQAPLMVVLMAAGTAVCWLVLVRRGEGKVEFSEQALHADFKRVFPFSHAMFLTPLDVWVGRLWQARLAVGLDYLPRLLAVLSLSLVNTVLTLPERLLTPLLLRGKPVRDPVFIIGTHRSGTTHLHNLLAQDPQFCTPLTYQTLNPHGCLFSGWLLMPILGVILPWRRPMDSLAFHIFSAQEEEFGIASSCGMSPHWGMSFPRQWPHYDQFIFPDRLTDSRRVAWQRVYLQFLRKVTFWTNRTPLLKNPYNTGRVAILRRMFPHARFIHIHRHPYDVFRSNQHLAREGHVVSQLQDPLDDRSYPQRFLNNYREMEAAWDRDSRELDEDQRAEVRFAELEQNPVGVIRAVYRKLGLEISPEFELRLHRYVAAQSDYRKNRHRDLSADDRHRIDSKLADFMNRWGYQQDQPASSEAA